MVYKGVFKGNVIILENGVQLSEGARVAVTVEQGEYSEVGEPTSEELEKRRIVITRMKEFGHRLADRNLDLSDLILEGRKELENRA